MTTHDFRPGDVVEYGEGVHVVKALCAGVATILHEPSGTVVHVDPANLLLRRRPEHPSRAASSLRADPVDHPAHYTGHPSGVECITVTEHMNFNVGNAVKYLWRAGRKGDALTDLRKAAWYVSREIERLTREAGS